MIDLICPPRVAPCDHPARRLALCPFHAQLSRRRRSARGARAGCLLRNGAAMGLKFGCRCSPENFAIPQATARWDLDEMAVTIAGRKFWLWRAVDEEGEVLDLHVHTARQSPRSDCRRTMSRACARTIGLRIRISRRVARCSASNRPDQPSVSCPFTPPFERLAPSVERRSMAAGCSSDRTPPSPWRRGDSRAP